MGSCQHMFPAANLNFQGEKKEKICLYLLNGFPAAILNFQEKMNSFVYTACECIIVIINASNNLLCLCKCYIYLCLTLHVNALL